MLCVIMCCSVRRSPMYTLSIKYRQGIETFFPARLFSLLARRRRPMPIKPSKKCLRGVTCCKVTGTFRRKPFPCSCITERTSEMEKGYNYSYKGYIRGLQIYQYMIYSKSVVNCSQNQPSFRKG